MNDQRPWAEQIAPAKVNLFLHIVGQRPDGYHEIESLFAFTDFGDRLRARWASHLNLTIDGPFAARLAELTPEGEEHNIVLKAAHRLREAAGQSELGAEITLTKNLPVAAGIGGGSSDAAAALRLLSDIWRLDCPASDLAEIALGLGADVPACLHSRPCLVSGIGERIVPYSGLPHTPCLLVNPGHSVPTPQVFSGFRESRQDFSDPIAPKLGATPRQLLQQTRNDLEPAAKEILPVIADVLQELAGIEGCLLSRMSGSGATCFGLFESVDQAQTASTALARRHPDWWCQAGRLSSS